MRYESENDVDLRLKGSLVSLGSRPVYVEGVQDKETVVVLDILDESRKNVKVVDLNLEPSALRLGYVTDERGNVFVASRKPARKYKQGLSQETFHIRPVFQPEGSLGRIRYTSKCVLDTMLGRFATIGDAFQKVRKGESKIIPFSHEWAVGEEQGDVCLVYRGKVVAFATDNSVKLLPEFFYLKESLEAVLK